MNRPDFVARLAERNPHLYAKDAEAVVSAILARITLAFAEGDRVELRGLESFATRSRTAREARNPRTGAAVRVERKSVVVFHPGKVMRHRLNGEGALV